MRFLWTVAHQVPLFMGFSRQEYCSGLPCPPPGDLPDPGIKLTSLMSPALAGGLAGYHQHHLEAFFLSLKEDFHDKSGILLQFCKSL